MTTTSTDVPTSPAWLNLSEILSAELIQQIPTVTEEVEALAPAVIELVERAKALIFGFDTIMAELDLPEEAEDGVWAAVRVYCGQERLHKAVLAIADAFSEL